MVRTLILPALTRHIGVVAGAAGAVKLSGIVSKSLGAEVEDLDLLYADIKKAVSAFEAELIACEAVDNLHKQAYAYAEGAADLLDILRRLVDRAETVVADDLWPMAKYQELLTVL